jgi:hypothetical protein
MMRLKGDKYKVKTNTLKHKKERRDKELADGVWHREANIDISP